MKTADLIINAGWIVTVDEANRTLENHSLVLHQGRILDLLPTADVAANYWADSTLDRSNHILMPGLINAHTHLAMNLFRGLADDLPLMTWLQDHIWPAEGQWMSEEFVRQGTELAFAESLLGGVTCTNDMYFFPDQVATLATAVGIRAVVGMIVLDFPTVWANDADHYLAKGMELHDQLKENQLVTTAFAPHAPYTVSSDPLIRIATLAAELDVPVHMHVHETASEVEDFLKQNGRRPLASLDELGLLTPSLMTVHMTQLLENEIERIAACGVHVLHCPESNMKLASGACPVSKLIDAGVNVALGTDGAASNNDIDMFGEMRTAALLAKHISGDAKSIPATQALRMATINGATALGLAHKTGSLEIGKAADCITIDCNTVGMNPMYNPLSHLVYATDRNSVCDVWVDGRQLVSNRVLQTIDKNKVIDNARQWAAKIGG